MLLDLDRPIIAGDTIYTYFFRPYSLVMKRWLNTLNIPGKSINVHYGSSERIWTKLIRRRQNYAIDLPIISYQLSSWKRDENHNQPPEIIRPVGGALLNAKPGFYVINFEISFWLKYLREADIIKYQIESMFTPELYLKVTNHTWKEINGMPYWIDCRITDFSDAYELEPGDKSDRVIRMDLKIEVDAKLPYISQGSKAKKIHVVETTVGLDSNLTKKNTIIKDNIQDDTYLSGVLDYLKTNTVI